MLRGKQSDFAPVVSPAQQNAATKRFAGASLEGVSDKNDDTDDIDATRESGITV